MEDYVGIWSIPRAVRWVFAWTFAILFIGGVYVLHSQMSHKLCEWPACHIEALVYVAPLGIGAAAVSMILAELMYLLWWWPIGPLARWLWEILKSGWRQAMVMKESIEALVNSIRARKRISRRPSTPHQPTVVADDTDKPPVKHDTTTPPGMVKPYVPDTESEAE